MKRILYTVRRDLVLLFRNGFVYAAVFVVLMLLLVLYLLPADFAYWLIPMALLGNFLVNGFYFGAAMMLLEKAENTLDVHFATPLRPWEYVVSKIAALATLTILETAAVVAFAGVAKPVVLALATVILVAAMTVAGLAMVTRYSSINQFLMPSVLATYLLLLPMADLLDLYEGPLLWLHPFYPGMVMLETAFRAVPASEFLIGTLLSLLWVGLGVWLCQQTVRRYAVSP